jgi:hypothetical protein
MLDLLHQTERQTVMYFTIAECDAFEPEYQIEQSVGILCD